MWFKTKCRLPFQDDPDYQDFLVFSVKGLLGGVPVDVTILPSYGEIGFDADEAGAREVGRLPHLHEARPMSDRGIILPRERTIL
jgi:hypothetical protein